MPKDSHKAVKKIFSPFFIIILVAILFFSGISHNGTMRIAEASFLDTIVAFVTINPLRVHITTPTEAEVGRNFKAEVIVENRGDVRISNVEVEIFISEGLTLVRKNSSQEIGIISGNKEKQISWQVKGTETGNFSISVRASGVVRGNTVIDEGNTVLVTIKEKSHPPGKPTNFFQIIFNIFQRWF